MTNLNFLTAPEAANCWTRNNRVERHHGQHHRNSVSPAWLIARIFFPSIRRKTLIINRQTTPSEKTFSSEYGSRHFFPVGCVLQICHEVLISSIAWEAVWMVTTFLFETNLFFIYVLEVNTKQYVWISQYSHNDMLFFRVKHNLWYSKYILLIMLGNFDLKLLQRAFGDSGGQKVMMLKLCKPNCSAVPPDYRADSSLRYNSSTAH